MSKRIFTYEEALETFPRVRDLTADAVKRVSELIVDQSEEGSSPAHGEDVDLETRYQRIVSEWVKAITAVGCEVKGLWLVDWDSGAGYYCWRYPEHSLGHFHGYEEGYQGRVPIN